MIVSGGRWYIIDVKIYGEIVDGISVEVRNGKEIVDGIIEESEYMGTTFSDELEFSLTHCQDQVVK